MAGGDGGVCILTGHGLKDPDATVAYHSTSDESPNEKFTQHGVTEAPFANSPVVVDNDLDKIAELLGSFR